MCGSHIFSLFQRFPYLINYFILSQLTGELEKDHRRIERQSVAAADTLDWIESKKNWRVLSTLIQYRCERMAGGVTTVTGQYYISNMRVSAESFAAVLRGYCRLVH